MLITTNYDRMFICFAELCYSYNLPLWIKLTFHHHKDFKKNSWCWKSFYWRLYRYTSTSSICIWEWKLLYDFLISTSHTATFSLHSICTLKLLSYSPWVSKRKFETSNFWIIIYKYINWNCHLHQCNQFFVRPLLPTYNYRCPIIFYLTDCVS